MRWAADVLGATRVRASASSVPEAKRLRTSIWNTAEAVIDGRAVSTSDRSTLNAFAAPPSLVPRTRPGRQAIVGAVGRGLGALLDDRPRHDRGRHGSTRVPDQALRRRQLRDPLCRHLATGHPALVLDGSLRQPGKGGGTSPAPSTGGFDMTTGGTTMTSWSSGAPRPRRARQEPGVLPRGRGLRRRPDDLHRRAGCDHAPTARSSARATSARRPRRS